MDPRWKNRIDFEDVNSLLHIMIRNKDTEVFLILTLPFYGTSSIRKRIRTPIYSGYLPETFSTRCRFMEHLPSENGSEHRFIPDTSRRRLEYRLKLHDVFHVLLTLPILYISIKRCETYCIHLVVQYIKYIRMEITELYNVFIV